MRWLLLVILGIQTLEDIRDKKLYWWLNTAGFAVFSLYAVIAGGGIKYVLIMDAFILFTIASGGYSRGDGKLLHMAVCLAAAAKSGVIIAVWFFKLQVISLVLFLLYVGAEIALKRSREKNYPYVPALFISYALCMLEL